MSLPLRSASFRPAISVLFAFIFLCAVFPLSTYAQDDGYRRSEENKRIVLEFYSMVFEKHLVREGFEKYVSAGFVQHNPSIPDGIEPDVKFLTERFSKNPQAVNEVKRSVAEGDLVVLHVHSRLNPDDRGRAIVDIFRVEGGKIVEHWDVIQPVPEKAANDNTMF